MVPKNKFFIGIFILFFTLFSCDKKRFYDQYQSLDGVWRQDDVKTFVVKQEDTLGRYNLFLNIRNDNNYPFSNLFVILETILPNKDILVDTLEYEMANADGTLMGSGFTDIKENKLWLKEDFRFNQIGDYNFKIRQAVRKSGEVEGIETLQGILEVGLRIENAE